MTISTEKVRVPTRRKHQWMGLAALIALSALVLPWLLTPEFDAIPTGGPRLTVLPDPPSIPPVAREPISEPIESPEARAELEGLLNTPMSQGDPRAASFILQAGAFRDEKNADALTARLQPLDLGRVYRRVEPTDALIRVNVGPFLSRELAEQARDEILKRLSVDSVIKPYDVREDGES